MGNHATSTGTHQAREAGNVLIAVLFTVVMLAGFVTMMQRSTLSTHKATHRNEAETRLLYVAESGLNFQAIELAKDPLGTLKDTNFKFDDASMEFVSGLRSIGTAGSTVKTFRLNVQYLSDGKPVKFADPTKPVENWNSIKITSTATLGPLQRRVAAWYRMELGDAFASAVISDSTATGPGGATKSDAHNGHISINDNANTHLFGGLHANGEVWHSGVGQLTNENAGTALDSFTGEINQSLSGTGEEIPDFTSEGGSDQLFDFNRFKAAAAAGAGQIYNTLADFAKAMNDANAAGVPLEGITVVNVDSSVEGKNPRLTKNELAKTGQYPIPGGINILGTLLFSFSNGTTGDYKIFITSDIAINPADLGSWNPTDESTYTTGYPPKLTKNEPWKVDITPTYENFQWDDGLPALMFDNGVVDMHGDVNISGVVYGPAFIEIENKLGGTQYFNGSIIGGGGVYLENEVAGGTLAVKFNPTTLKNLATFDNRGKTLTRTGFAIIR